MAEKINIDLLINAANSANTLKDLKQSLKDIKNAAAGVDENSAAFIDLQKAAGDAKNKIDDLNTSIKSQSGAPIENVSNSVGLLSGQLKTLNFKEASNSVKLLSSNLKGIDFKSLSSGLKGLGSNLLELGESLLTNPIFLLAATLTAIGVAMWSAFGDDVVNWINGVSDATVEQQKATEALKEKNDALIKSIDAENKLSDAKITLMKAQHKPLKDIIAAEKEVNAAKQKKLELQLAELKSDKTLQQDKIKDVIANDSITESIYRVYEATLKKMGLDKQAADIDKVINALKAQRAKEALDALKDDNNQIIELQADLLNIQADNQNLDNELTADNIKNSTDRADAAKKAAKDIQDAMDTDADALIKLMEKQNEVNEALKTDDEQAIDKILEKRDEYLTTEQELLDEGLISQQEYNDAVIKIKQDAQDQINVINSNTLKKQNEEALKLLEAQKENAETAGQETADIEVAIQKQKLQTILDDVKSTDADKIKAQADYNAAIKKLQDEELQNEKALADAKQSIRDAEIEAVAGGAELIAAFNSKNKDLQNAAFVVEKGAAAAKVFIDGIQERAAITAKYALIPGGEAIAAAEITASRIKTGISLASILATTISKFSSGGASGAGGGAGAGHSSSGGIGSSSSSQGNFVNPNLFAVGGNNNTFNNPLGGNNNSNSNQQEPIKAYVVGQDISKEQNKRSIIERRAQW